MNKILIILSLFVFAEAAQAQVKDPAKRKELKAEWIKTCVDEIATPSKDTAFAAALSRITDSFCDCTSEKVLDNFSAKEVKDIMNDEEKRKRIQPVTQDCLDKMLQDTAELFN